MATMADQQNKKMETAKKVPVAKKAKPLYSVPKLWLRLLIAGVLGLVLIVGIYFSSQKLQTLVKEAEQKRSQMVALAGQDESYKQVSSALASLTDEQGLLEKALLNEEGVVDFIGKVEEIRKETTVELGIFKFVDDQPRTDSTGNSYLDLTIEANGTLANLEKFSADFFRLPLLLRVKNLALTKMDESQSNLVMEIWLYVDQNFYQEVTNEKK